MAELADALDLGSSVFDVGVQVPSSAPQKRECVFAFSFLFYGWDLNPKRAFCVKKDSTMYCFLTKRCADGYRSHKAWVVKQVGCETTVSLHRGFKSYFAPGSYSLEGTLNCKNNSPNCFCDVSSSSAPQKRECH